MSLIGSIRLAGNTLRADQIAMQVIGQNIANANTPGYIREEVLLVPGPVQKIGDLTLGLGVDVAAVIQKLDAFLEHRLRGSVSDKANAEAQENYYIQLESLLNELTDLDLSTSLNEFMASISEVLNQPGDLTIRSQAVSRGEVLTNDLRYLSQQVEELRDDTNNRISAMADDINRRVQEIAKLNVQIAETEGGSISTSDAVGLRDQRLTALEDLAGMIEIRSVEQADGTVAVYCGGDYLVFGSITREVEPILSVENGRTALELRIKETNSKLDASSGEYRGLVASRDDILGSFLDSLDGFAATLAFEFNKIYSGGQGLTGFQELTSDFRVDAVDRALDVAGLDYTPVNGAFEVLVRNKSTGLTHTTEIMVDLDGVGRDTTLEDLTAQLDAIDGINASITLHGGLTISSDSGGVEFAFSNDTSGVLAALGVNTFFNGSSAATLGVNSILRNDPSKFAASRGGIGADTDNAVELARFADLPLDSNDGLTLANLYENLVSRVAEGSSAAQSLARGLTTFEETLRGQRLATTGVNLDEEAIKLISHQQSFQASSRFISTLRDLFDVLLNI